MKLKNYILIFIIPGLALLSCKKLDNPKSADERRQWINSLNDSINNYQNSIDTITETLNQVNNRLGELILNFEHITNPKAVEGFYILKEFKNLYPLKNTGLIARLNENEEIEILAALKDKTFTHISLMAGSDSYTTNAIPHDQAFNYISGDINTVCFSGTVADSIASFISDKVAEEIQVAFIENSQTGTYILSENEKKMIKETEAVFSLRQQSENMQKELARYSSQIMSCRKILLDNDSLLNK